MPVTGWHAQAIRRLFSGTLPGDWGDEGDPDTGVAVLRSTNFRDDGSIDYRDLAFRSIAAARLEKRGIHRGTILIEKAGGSSTRPAGRVVYCDRDFDGTASNFVEIVRVAQQYVPQYVFYLLYWNYHAGRVHKYQQQTTGIINFKLCEYNDEEVLVPAKPAEQSKIAEVLSAVDRAIKQTDTLIAKQQRIKTGLMQDLLTRGIDEHGNLRSEQTHEFKDSPLGRIPVEWEVPSLGQCVRADAPICYGILMPGQGVDNGVPVIKVKDIVGGRIVQDNLLLTDRRIDRQYRRSRLRSGDLVITIRGTTGRLAVVPPDLDGANITQDTARVRLSDDHSARFCFYCLQSESAQGQIALHTIGQAVKGINIGDVKRLLLGMPSLHEQERLANRFEGLEKTTYATSRALAKLKSTKAGLMQDLLTGNRRVTALLEQREEVTT